VMSVSVFCSMVPAILRRVSALPRPKVLALVCKAFKIVCWRSARAKSLEVWRVRARRKACFPLK